MTAATVRILVAALACVAFALGGAAGVVAGDHDEDGEYDADLTLEGSAEAAQGGGNGTYDCAGDVTFRHHCDKDAQVDAGPAGVDYEGYNWAETTDRQGGGGDVFVITVANESGTVGFDCHLQPSPEQPCTTVAEQGE